MNFQERALLDLANEFDQLRNELDGRLLFAVHHDLPLDPWLKVLEEINQHLRDLLGEDHLPN